MVFVLSFFEIKTMKHLLIILGLLLVGNTTYCQITISNDSLYVNNELSGAYSLNNYDPYEFVVNIFLLKEIGKGDKMAFEALVNEDLKSKGLLQTARLRFQYQWNPSSNAFNGQISEPAYVYAEIVGTQRLLSSKVTIQVDFGQSRGFFTDTRIRDERTGKVQTFNSMIDAMNYMALDGWEFTQAYTITYGRQNVYHYLLRRQRND
jgi:hypothetical protein